jgi:hypothetical protein
LSLRGVVDESRFHFQSLRLTAKITTYIGGNAFSWHDEVENVGGRDATMQMLYHFNVGQPLLQPGARITAPIAEVAPLTPVAAARGIDAWNVMPPPEPGSAEQVYVAKLAADPAGQTYVLASGMTQGESVSMSFNVRGLPCLTVWRNSAAEADGYVIGIEPGTNYPNPRPFEATNGRTVGLKPGQKWSSEVAVSWHRSGDSTAEVCAAIEAIQNATSPIRHKRPRDVWSFNG